MQVAQNVPTIVLKIQVKNFFFKLVFFRRGEIKEAERETWKLGMFDIHSKINKSKNNFCRKTKKNVKLFLIQKYFAVF